MEDMLTPKDLAREFDISEKRVRAELRTHHGQNHGHGQRWFIDMATATAFRQRRARRAR